MYRLVKHCLSYYADSQGLAELAEWARCEVDGYRSGLPKDVDHNYRVLMHNWKDALGRSMMPEKETMSMFRFPVPNGVGYYEQYQQIGCDVSYPALREAVPFMGQLFYTAHITGADIRVLLSSIRRVARQKLNASVPRTATVKMTYPSPDFGAFVVNSELARILSNRWLGANNALDANAPTGALLLLGSILEGYLLDKVTSNMAAANQAAAVPKDKATNAVLPFDRWSLESLITVAHELKWLDKDVKDFAIVLRSYRNFIHPREQLRQGLTVTEHTCRIAFEVIRAALS